jgi:hypothetical protein
VRLIRFAATTSIVTFSLPFQFLRSMLMESATAPAPIQVVPLAGQRNGIASAPHSNPASLAAITLGSDASLTRETMTAITLSYDVIGLRGAVVRDPLASAA